MMTDIHHPIEMGEEDSATSRGHRSSSLLSRKTALFRCFMLIREKKGESTKRKEKEEESKKKREGEEAGIGKRRKKKKKRRRG